MAYRDSQSGHAFMYVDVAKLLKEQSQVATDAREGAPVTTDKDNTAQFTPVQPEIAPLSDTERQVAIQKIQGNLDRLQSLHHKLHAMLEELNKIPKK